MKIHKFLWLVIVSFALLVPGLAKDKVVVESKWIAVPIQIDGKYADWSPDELVANKDYDLSYAFKNDADHLYLLFMFNFKEGQKENRYMSSIDFTGLTLWPNVEGKEKRSHGLRFYPKLVTGDQLIQELEKQGQTLTDPQKQGIKSKPRYTIFACEAVDKKSRAVPDFKTSGALFQTAKIQRSVVFEYAIPMALLQDPASPVKWNPSQPLTIGFEWGGLTDEMKKAYAGRVGDQGARADASGTNLERQLSGYEGGDSFRDSQSSLADSRRGIPKKYDFWISLKVAQKQ